MPDRDGAGMPIIPDRVADKIMAGKHNWAVEEVVGEQAVEAVAERNARAAEPIHAEDLRPMSRAEAAARTTFDGEHLISAPQTRRVLPAPFRRPRIVVGRLPWEEPRQWRNIPAQLVEEGDIIPGIGKVTDVETRVRHETVAGVPGVATGLDIVLTGLGGNREVHDGMDTVRAFR